MTGRVQPPPLRFVRRSPTEAVVVPSLDAWEARHVPAAAVEALRPPRARVVTGVLWGAVLAGTVATAIAPSLVPLSADKVVYAAALVASGVLCVVIVLRCHPVGYVIGAVGGGVVGWLAGGTAGSVVVACLALAVCAVPTWRGYAARARWFPRLDALLDRHRRVEGTVVEVQRSDRSSGSSRVLHVWVASPDAPGVEWQADVERAPLTVAVGRPVRVWYHPEDPEAAVLCLPRDVADPRVPTADAPAAAHGAGAPATVARVTAAAPKAAGGGAPAPRALLRAPRPPDPTVLLPLPAVDRDAPFPRAAVESFRPSTVRPGPGVAAGVLLGALAAVLTGPQRVELPARVLVTLACLVVGVGLGYVLLRRAHPAALLTGAVVGQVLSAAGAGDPRTAMYLTVGQAGLAWWSWRRLATGRARWARLAPLLDAPVRADGVVQHVDARPAAVDGDPVRVRVVAAYAPGTVWEATGRVSPALRPFPGQRVAVWHAPADAGAAVLGVLDARRDPAWHGGAGRGA